jgi:hypothetical protein
MWKIKGNWENRKVFIHNGDMDWIELSPSMSQKVYNHSPDGFNWSYAGSGPAQLALALLLLLAKTDEEKSEAVYFHQQFKREVIMVLPQGNFQIELDIKLWLANAKQMSRLYESLQNIPKRSKK